MRPVPLVVDPDVREKMLLCHLQDWTAQLPIEAIGGVWAWPVSCSCQSPFCLIQSCSYEAAVIGKLGPLPMDLIGSLEFGQHTEVQSCFLLGGVSDQTLRPAEFPGQPTTSYAVPR